MNLVQIVADSTLSRRQWLRGSLAAASLLATGACARAPLARPQQRRLARVHAEDDRLIRAVAGLRPYRPSGFVLDTQRLDDRTIVHNYGHGGAGITLSWGTSMLATALAAQSAESRYAVLGAGVIGLTTARLLQDRGYQVTIYTRDLPPNTTSNIAGGQWSPFSVFDNDVVTPAFLDRFYNAARLSHRRFQTMIGPRYGIRWIEQYSLAATPPPPPQRTNPLADLNVDSEVIDPRDSPFDFPYVRRFWSMLIETNVFLDALMEDFLIRGGKIVIREFKEVRQLTELPERVIMNCTGLGSRALFGDQELTPMRGQLAILLPQPEVDYIVLSGPNYMFPRSDGILLGGTRELDVWSTDPEPDAIRGIIAGQRAIMDRLRDPR